MRVVGLISGGKDSCFNMMQCVGMGHEIVALANLYPATVGEIDSYMYQTVGSEAIEIYSKAMELPLFRREITGTSKEIDMVYKENQDDEVEDLYYLLKDVKKEIDFEGVSCGAILSDYQRIRVENVCSRLNLVSLSYLWRRNQKTLLQDMIDCDLNAIIIKTAALGMDPLYYLGRNLKHVQLELIELNERYGNHICGEGGEYETYTFDCPLFKKTISIIDYQPIIHSDDGVVKVAYLRMKKLQLKEKRDAKFDFSRLVKYPLPALQLPLIAGNVKDASAKCAINWVKENRMPKNWDFRTSLVSTCVRGQYQSVSNVYALCKPNPSKESIIASTIVAFDNMAAQLNVHGLALTDIIYLQLCLADMKHFSPVNIVYNTYFRCNPPSRVCVTSLLSDEDVGGDKEQIILFQMDCIAYLHSSVYKKAIHVQGISHWAPANIGPYSQCTLMQDLCFVAGQIGLVPAAMKIIEGGILHEAVLALNHVKNILYAMHESLHLFEVIQCICYITDEKHLDIVRSIWQHNALHYDRGLMYRIIYVVVESLPWNALVEWQVIAAKNSRKDDAFAFSHMITCNYTEVIDFARELPRLANQFLFMCERRSSFNLFNQRQAHLLCVKPNRYLPLQARLFYTKHNLTFKDIAGARASLPEKLNSFPITWIPVKAVYKHTDPARVSMTLVGLAVNTT